MRSDEPYHRRAADSSSACSVSSLYAFARSDPWQERQGMFKPGAFWRVGYIVMRAQSSSITAATVLFQTEAAPLEFFSIEWHAW